MRTTIELSEEQRRRLLALAAERGALGLSEIVAEAIDRYLAEAEVRAGRVTAALGALGSLTDAEAASLKNAASRQSGAWR